MMKRGATETMKLAAMTRPFTRTTTGSKKQNETKKEADNTTMSRATTREVSQKDHMARTK